MTQQQAARAYADWKQAYREEVVERVKHWGTEVRWTTRWSEKEQAETV